MVSAPDSLIVEMTIMHYGSVWPKSATVDSCFTANQYSIADDEPAHPKGIQYKPTSGMLQILPSAELKQLDNSQSLSMRDSELGCASLSH